MPGACKTGNHAPPLTSPPPPTPYRKTPSWRCWKGIFQSDGVLLWFTQVIGGTLYLNDACTQKKWRVPSVYLEGMRIFQESFRQTRENVTDLAYRACHFCNRLRMIAREFDIGQQGWSLSGSSAPRPDADGRGVGHLRHAKLQNQLDEALQLLRQILQRHDATP